MRIHIFAIIDTLYMCSVINTKIKVSSVNEFPTNRHEIADASYVYVGAITSARCVFTCTRALVVLSSRP